VKPVIVQAAAYDPFLRFDTFVAMGWYNIVWIVCILALFMAVKQGKVKFVVIGKNEKGARELFGMPVWPVFRGAHLYVAGILGVRKAPIVPVPIELRQKVLIDQKVKMEYVGTAFVQVLREWKYLKLAIYSTLDNDTKDLENEMRDKQSASNLRNGVRRILTNQWNVDVLTLEGLNALCATELLEELGSQLVKLNNEEYTFDGMHVAPIGDGSAIDPATAASAALASGRAPFEVIKGGSAPAADAL